jgi:hypothetical protein
MDTLNRKSERNFEMNLEKNLGLNLASSVNFVMVQSPSLTKTELMSFSITQTGLSTVTVYASTLPAGMYLYTLVVDNIIIDTKRMILTK